MKNKWMRVVCVAAALAMGLSLSGCTMVNMIPSGAKYQEVGKGPLVTAKYPGGDFTTVEVSANLELIYSSQLSDTVTVELHENLLDFLEVRAEGNKLIVNATKEFRYENSKMGKLYIGAPNLKELIVGGATTIKEADPIVGDSFYLDVHGACDAKLQFDVKELTVSITGAGSLNMSGTADTADLSISGAGDLKADDLQTRTAKVRLAGAGSAEISCSEALDASISGAGSLVYRGDPEVTKNVSGAGAVRKR